MSGLGKKGPHYVPREAARLLDKLSKAALMDIAWNLALLGTDETSGQVLAHVAREAALVTSGRGDVMPQELANAAIVRLDSDPIDGYTAAEICATYGIRKAVRA